MSDINKCRFRFEKTGRAIYISHLDLMRTFQRAFIRAGIAIRHTEGFNPHPYISIVLPLQLGSESVCEYLDAEIAGECPDIVNKLSVALPEGIKVVSVNEPVMKPGEVGFVRCSINLFYDNSVIRGKAENIEDYLKSGPVVINKKTKRGIAELDIAPHITELVIENADSQINITALFSAFEPTVNPSDLVSALNLKEDFRLDFAKYKRLEIYNKNKEIFR